MNSKQKILQARRREKLKALEEKKKQQDSVEAPVDKVEEPEQINETQAKSEEIAEQLKYQSRKQKKRLKKKWHNHSERLKGKQAPSFNYLL